MRGGDGNPIVSFCVESADVSRSRVLGENPEAKGRDLAAKTEILCGKSRTIRICDSEWYGVRGEHTVNGVNG